MMRRRIAILLSTIAAVTVMAFGLAIGASAQADVSATVRSVTARFNSIEQARKAGYVPFYVCAEQPGVGTMGQHYVNFDLVGNPAIDPLQPEALVYEPRDNGKALKLVAVEYVVFADAWDAGNLERPSLFGREFDFTPFPNRYGLPAFYSLHAWIGKPNPAGYLEPYNPRIDC